jgi:hypothetical protein
MITARYCNVNVPSERFRLHFARIKSKKYQFESEGKLQHVMRVRRIIAAFDYTHRLTQVAIGGFI